MSFSKEVEQAVAVGYGIGINVVDEKCTLKFEEALRKADELSTAIGEFFREYAKATHALGLAASPSSSMRAPRPIMRVALINCRVGST